MSIVVACPNCDKTYNLPEDRMGRKARCSACRHVFIPTTDEEYQEETAHTDPTLDDPVFRSHAEFPPHSTEPACENSWTSEESPFAGALAAPSISTSAETREVTLGRLALDHTTMTYAMQWWGLWAVAVCLAGVLAYYVNALIALPAVFLMSWVCLVGAVGGIAHLAVQNVVRGEVHWSEGWGLFARRGLSLVLGSCTVGLLVVAGTAMLSGGVFAVSHLPYAGGPLGGLLVVPTFAVILFLFVLTCNLHLILVIIGVEDCSAWQALKKLTALVRRDWFALLGWSYVSPFLVVIGTTMLVGVFTCAGLGGALMLCGGEQLLFILSDGISLNNVLHALSAAFVVAGAMAFVTVFATLQFTVLYCRFA